ncbi:MAG TPA: iron chelate uptake ABC transporter family permease subunit, partial [Pyrinomonadaceae bacterium]|nr:iron chelate uptake ABC transporter family permease subunit [Pyrinomonadaceae bacterium]
MSSVSRETDETAGVSEGTAGGGRADSNPQPAIRNPQSEASAIGSRQSSPAGARLRRALLILSGALVASTLVALWVGYQPLDLTALRHDETARTVFFKLRLPRVLMAGVVGASLATVGAALQAMFRNPLAEPLTLGVSGGGALGASVAIAFGMGARVAGLPIVFVAAFAGAGAAVFVVYRLARTGSVVLPGALLLAGVVMNLIAAAGVVVIQYFADYSRALQILRWTIGSLDVVGFDLIWRMML